MVYTSNTRAISTLCFYIPHNSVINWPKNCNVLGCKILKKWEGQSKAKEQLRQLLNDRHTGTEGKFLRAEDRCLSVDVSSMR